MTPDDQWEMEVKYNLWCADLIDRVNSDQAAHVTCDEVIRAGSRDEGYRMAELFEWAVHDMLWYCPECARRLFREELP